MTHKSLAGTIRSMADKTIAEEKDYEGEMAKGELQMLAKRATELANMMSDDMQLEAWVQSKITKAEDYINSVYDYMKTKGNNNAD